MHSRTAHGQLNFLPQFVFTVIHLLMNYRLLIYSLFKSIRLNESTLPDIKIEILCRLLLHTLSFHRNIMPNMHLLITYPQLFVAVSYPFVLFNYYLHQYHGV